MKNLYELGFEQLRITISFEHFGPDFLAAIPYVRAARALGIDVVGIIDSFAGFDLLEALMDSRTRGEVFDTYQKIFGGSVLKASKDIEREGTFSAQILNEPTYFYGISPIDYVRNFLRPAYLHLKEIDPSTLVVAAAPVSSAEGFLRAIQMIETGSENYCDRIAFHIYSKRFIERLADLTDKPVWITESAVEGPANHLEWFTDVFPKIRNTMPRVEQIYWFDLFDFNPGSFRLYNIIADPTDEYRSVEESTALISHLKQRVFETTEGKQLPYEDLISDIMIYFPTEEDLRIIESTSYGLPDDFPKRGSFLY